MAIRLKTLFLAVLFGFGAAVLAWECAASVRSENTRTPDEKVRYENGLRAARNMFKTYDRLAATKDITPEVYAGEEKAEQEFAQSLAVNGKEGVEAAEYVAFQEHRNSRPPWRFFSILEVYLGGQGGVWGKHHLNQLLQSDLLNQHEKARLLNEIATLATEPANWLDEGNTSPVCRNCVVS